jgi:hypothetical protein
MLNERKARSLSYDAKGKTALVTVTGAGGGSSRVTRGSVLLDAQGEVVGVDIDEGSPSRVVVMVGKHESVSRTQSCRLTLTLDPQGEVAAVLVHDFART